MHTDIRNLLELKISVRKNKILSNTLEIMATTNNKKDALTAALNEFVQLPWLPIKPRGAIFLKDPESNSLNLYTFTKNFSEELKIACSKVDYGHCLCGRAAQSEEIVFADCIDHRHETLTDNMPKHGHYNVPFFYPNKKLAGVTVFYLNHGHKRNEEEVQFLHTIAFALGLICEKFDNERIKNELPNAIVTTIHHKLNNPLTVAMGNIKILKDEVGSNKHVEKVENALSRINDNICEINEAILKPELSLKPYGSHDSILKTIDKDKK